MSYKLKLIKFIDNNQTVYRTDDYLYYDVKYYKKMWGKHFYKIKTNDEKHSEILLSILDYIEFYDPEVWKDFKITEEKMDTIQEIIE
jgi:hypothetical protein